MSRRSVVGTSAIEAISRLTSSTASGGSRFNTSAALSWSNESRRIADLRTPEISSAIDFSDLRHIRDQSGSIQPALAEAGSRVWIIFHPVRDLLDHLAGTHRLFIQLHRIQRPTGIARHRHGVFTHHDWNLLSRLLHCYRCPGR